MTELSYKVGCCFCSSWGKLINRSIIGDRRYNINLSYGEDGVFMFLVSNKIKKVSLHRMMQFIIIDVMMTV